MGKNSFPDRASTDGSSALRAAGIVLWGYHAFSFALRRASKPALFRSQGSSRAGTISASKAGTQAPHGPQSPQRPPGTSLSAKASHNPSQAARIGCCARGPGARSQALCTLLREPAIFFTAAQFLLVLPLEILTQNVTQNIESRRGAGRNDLRVFGDFRPKKVRKALGRSGLTTRLQLITRRSEVQVSPHNQKVTAFQSESGDFLLFSAELPRSLLRFGPPAAPPFPDRCPPI